MAGSEVAGPSAQELIILLSYEQRYLWPDERKYGDGVDGRLDSVTLRPSASRMIKRCRLGLLVERSWISLGVSAIGAQSCDPSLRPVQSKSGS
jgi:hypothetical protein